MKKTTKKTGRPKIKIDYELVKRLAKILCTGEEIAGVLEIDYDTLNARIKEDFKVSFSDYIKKYNEQGKASLRRMQYKSASDGNASMLIWLGKQFLGQKDKQDLNHSGNFVIQEVKYNREKNKNENNNSI